MFLLSFRFFLGLMSLVLVLGLGLIFGLFNYLSPQNHPAPLSTLSPVTSLPVSLALNLDSPEDDKLVSSGELLISGKTSPGATLVLLQNDLTQILSVKPSGDFSSTISLEEGVNLINLSAFDSQGNSKQEIRSVFFSKENI